MGINSIQRGEKRSHGKKNGSQCLVDGKELWGRGEGGKKEKRVLGVGFLLYCKR